MGSNVRKKAVGIWAAENLEAFFFFSFVFLKFSFIFFFLLFFLFRSFDQTKILPAAHRHHESDFFLQSKGEKKELTIERTVPLKLTFCCSAKPAFVFTESITPQISIFSLNVHWIVFLAAYFYTLTVALYLAFFFIFKQKQILINQKWIKCLNHVCIKELSHVFIAF